MSKCIGWEKGCICRNCMTLDRVMKDPRINTPEDIAAAEKRQWNNYGQHGTQRGARKKGKKDEE